MNEQDFEKAVKRLGEEKEKALSTMNAEYKAAVQPKYDALIAMVTEKMKEDDKIAEAVLLEHKSFERCMKYLYKQATQLRSPSQEEMRRAREDGIPIVTPVDGGKIAEWICSYLLLDDKAAVIKEEKQKAEDAKKKKEREEKAREAEKEKMKKQAEQKAEAKPKKQKPKNTENDDQMSFFELLGVQG